MFKEDCPSLPPALTTLTPQEAQKEFRSTVGFDLDRPRAIEAESTPVFVHCPVMNARRASGEALDNAKQVPLGLK